MAIGKVVTKHKLLLSLTIYDPTIYINITCNAHPNKNMSYLVLLPVLIGANFYHMHLLVLPLQGTRYLLPA